MEALEDFCLLQAQSIQGQLEGTIPSTDDGQSADNSSLVDASSVDISAMGTMNNGGGGQRSWERGMGQSQEAVEGAGMSAATQDSVGQAPAIPQGQEDMGSPPELPSGEAPQEAPGQTARGGGYPQWGGKRFLRRGAAYLPRRGHGTGASHPAGRRGR